MIVTTTACTKFGHPEFLLEADESHVPEPYLENIRRTVEEMVSRGSVFKPDQTFQIGWMLTQVRVHDSSRLTLFEPDMKAFPIKWVSGITETLRQMMLQLFMLDSVSLRSEIDIPTIRQSLIACDQYTSANFFMERQRPSAPADSGWFLGCIDEEHDHNNPTHLHRISLYEALLRQPGVQGFIAFPVGSAVVFDQTSGMSILKDDHKLDIAQEVSLIRGSRSNTRPNNAVMDAAPWD